MKNELQKIRQMTPGEKWDYFKTYYLVQTVIGVIVLILAVFFIRDMKMGSREVLASGCLINVAIDEEGFLFLTDGYVDFCGKSIKKASVFLSVDNTLDFMPGNPLDKDSYVMALTAQIYAGEYQYLILDQEAWEHFQASDIYADLAQTLTQEQQEAYADRMIRQTVQSEDGTHTETATALDLAGTAFAKRFHLEPQEAYLVFIETAQEKYQDDVIEKKQRIADYILTAE